MSSCVYLLILRNDKVVLEQSFGLHYEFSPNITLLQITLKTAAQTLHHNSLVDNGSS